MANIDETLQHLRDLSAEAHRLDDLATAAIGRGFDGWPTSRDAATAWRAVDRAAGEALPELLAEIDSLRAAPQSPRSVFFFENDEYEAGVCVSPFSVAQTGAVLKKMHPDGRLLGHCPESAFVVAEGAPAPPEIHVVVSFTHFMRGYFGPNATPVLDLGDVSPETLRALALARPAGERDRDTVLALLDASTGGPP